MSIFGIVGRKKVGFRLSAPNSTNPNKVALLKADIHDELESLERLVEEYRKAEAIVGRSAKEVPFHDRAAIGYILHGFYIEPLSEA